MSVNDTPLSSASPAPSDPAQDRPAPCARCEGEPGRLSQWRLRLLERAAESAVTVLEKITADVVAGKSTGQFQLGEAAPEGDLGLVYSRISKALRQARFQHITHCRKPLARETGEGGTHCASNGRVRVHMHQFPSTRKTARNPLNPHPPNPAGRVPPSPALRARGFLNRARS